MRLAILGDTHYTNAAYHKEALAGRSRSPTARADVTRHAWTTEFVLPRVLGQVRAAAPDVVLQLGDVNQGHCDDAAGDVAELEEALAFFKRLDCPLLFARGTHEGRTGSAADAAYRRTFLTEIGRTLAGFGNETEGLDTSYAVDLPGLRLIVLDYTTFARDGAADALLQRHLMEGARNGQRVFVCGHPPLIPIGRPFFSRLPYATTVRERIAASATSVDAYFCGHTHNQVVTMHRMDGGARGEWWLPQLQGAPVGDPEAAPVALASVRGLLPAADTVRYGWGYLEDSCPGWFLVEVNKTGVRARWRLVSRPGEESGEVRWRDAGSAEVVSVPPPPREAALPSLPLVAGDARVKGVRLRAAGMGSQAPHAIWLNGVEAGRLPVLEYFDARQGVEVPDAVWPAVRDRNELVVMPAAEGAAEERCLGGFVLEVTRVDGAVVRSAVEPALYVTSNKWEEWRWCTPGLRWMEPEAPITFGLDFV